MVSGLANGLLMAGPRARAGYAALAGVVAALTLAPLQLMPALFVAFPVLVLLLDGALAGRDAVGRFRAGFAVGWAFGAGYFLGGLWWISAAFLVDVGAPQLVVLMPFAVVAMALGLALFTGLGTALAALIWRGDGTRVLALAAGLAFTDWLRGVVLTGFPWNTFGYGLAVNPVLMQGAAVVGVYGLGFIAVFVGASPAALLAGRRSRAVPLAAVVVLAGLVGGGALRLAQDPGGVVPGVKLRLMQPNIPQDRRWRPDFRAELMETYRTLSAGDDGLAGVTHLLWPESAFPFLLDRDPAALKTIADLLPPGTQLLTGAIRAEAPGPGERKPRYYNALMALDDEARVEAVYDKSHLVPFGEYLPWRAFLAWTGIGAFLYPLDDFSAGPGPRTLAIPGTPAFSPVICYEAIFPGRVVDPRSRPSWILNVTNDGWFGDTAGPWQHLHQARLRAVEEGMPLVRVANTGVSAVIDSLGRMSKPLKVGERGTLDAPLPVALPDTLFARLGNFSLFVMIFLSLGVVFAAKSGRRHHP
jgi:apolipoprotein N-acyltransferase